MLTPDEQGAYINLQWATLPDPDAEAKQARKLLMMAGMALATGGFSLFSSVPRTAMQWYENEQPYKRLETFLRTLLTLYGCDGLRTRPAGFDELPEMVARRLPRQSAFGSMAKGDGEMAGREGADIRRCPFCEKGSMEERSASAKALTYRCRQCRRLLQIQITESDGEKKFKIIAGASQIALPVIAFAALRQGRKNQTGSGAPDPSGAGTNAADPGTGADGPSGADPGSVDLGDADLGSVDLSTLDFSGVDFSGLDLGAVDAGGAADWLSTVADALGF